MDIERPNYFAIITANVRYDEKLKPNEKLLFSEITSLANKEGYCYATNKYFADLYKVSTRSITKWIANLEKQGYIETEMFCKEDKKITYRKIVPLWNKSSRGYRTKVLGGIELKFYHNNINNNNKYNNNINLDNNKKELEEEYQKNLSETAKNILNRKRK